MKKIIIPALAVLALIGAGCYGPSPAGTGQQAAAPASNKFADQPYYKNAYLISSDPLSADAKAALSGFKMTKTAQPDGTTRIILEANKPGYQSQQYDLKPGEQLYFVEQNLTDDDPVKDTDNYTQDDHAVVVDAAGNVVQGLSDWVQVPAQ